MTKYFHRALRAPVRNTIVLRYSLKQHRGLSTVCFHVISTNNCYISIPPVEYYSLSLSLSLFLYLSFRIIIFSRKYIFIQEIKLSLLSRSSIMARCSIRWRRNTTTMTDTRISRMLKTGNTETRTRLIYVYQHDAAILCKYLSIFICLFC